MEYIKIYKNFYYTPDVPQLINNYDISIYTLHNFNNDYNSISKLNDIKKWCEDNGIYSLKQFTKIINNNIRNIYYILNNHKFNTLNEFSHKQPPFSTLNIKTKYLSIDLKHAFSQLIDSSHIFEDKFDDIIFNNLPDFMRLSKKIRLFTYNQIPNSDFYAQYAYKLFDKLFELDDNRIVKYIKNNNLIPISCNVDELVYDITEIPNLFNEFIGDHTINGIDIHLNTFEQHHISFIDPFTKKERTIPIREYATHTNFVTHTCPYMNQIYKAYNNLPIIENDLYIPDQTNWNKIIKLDEPIIITNVE